MRISIIGTVGLPANYGGFETLVENLVKHHHRNKLGSDLNVYCSSKFYSARALTYLSAKLYYIPLNANGVQSIFYDIASLLLALWRKSDIILLLGVSGALCLPFVRLFSKARIITNVDGIEWRREKWRGLAKYFLRASERAAVRYSDVVIADNQVIADYIGNKYKLNSHVIAYGGDHVTNVEARSHPIEGLLGDYAIVVCRIEPENNIDMLIDAFSKYQSLELVVIGNWGHSTYGKDLRLKYSAIKNIFLIDPIYDLGVLKTLRSNAKIYVHGHSAGGTNPSLVEAMSFGLPVLAFDCEFNRATTKNKALYFRNSKELLQLLRSDANVLQRIASNMLDIANSNYTWSSVGDAYFDLFERECMI